LLGLREVRLFAALAVVVRAIRNKALYQFPKAGDSMPRFYL